MKKGQGPHKIVICLSSPLLDVGIWSRLKTEGSINCNALYWEVKTDGCVHVHRLTPMNNRYIGRKATDISVKQGSCLTNYFPQFDATLILVNIKNANISFPDEINDLLIWNISAWHATDWENEEMHSLHVSMRCNSVNLRTVIEVIFHIVWLMTHWVFYITVITVLFG